jgi:hypothetical protein
VTTSLIKGMMSGGEASTVADTITAKPSGAGTDSKARSWRHQNLAENGTDPTHGCMADVRLEI